MFESYTLHMEERAANALSWF